MHARTYAQTNQLMKRSVALYCHFVRGTPSHFCRIGWLRTLTLTPSLARTHYEVLGVQRSASQEEIKAAFVCLSKETHPDLNPGLRNAQQKSARINEAYGVLGNASKRELYDLQLQTVERYRVQFAASYPHRHHHSEHAGSATRSSPFGSHGNTNTGGTHQRKEGVGSDAHDYGFSDTEWEHWYRKSAEERRRGHWRIIGYLVAMMVAASVVQAARISWAHKCVCTRACVHACVCVW